MQAGTWLRTATEQLRAAAIDSARLDCLMLLEDATGHDRSWLLAHEDLELDPSQLAPLQAALARRTTHEPLAYLRGHAEFYGRRFAVTPDTLVPRPESEAIISLALQLAAQAPLATIADIGTGSGCLGLTLALELPQAQVTLTDTSAAALAVARGNGSRLGANVQFMKADLLDYLPTGLDLVVANLPYVPDGYAINQAASHEPRQALFSGADGLDHYRRFWQQAAVCKPYHVISEALPQQHSALAALAQSAGYHVTRSEHFIQQLSL